MGFTTLAELPKRIGEAEIEIRPRQMESWRGPQPLAERKDKTLVLTESKEARVFSLLKGQQFLYTAPDTASNSTRRLFFGGMDESPFMVELDYGFIEHLIDGERAFFESLKPAIIKSGEQVFSSKTRRQGDFFAVKSKKNMDLSSLMRAHLKQHEITFKVVEELPLKETRHMFTGLLGRTTGGFIAEGILKAPDHEPLLLDGPHIVEQALGLLRPKIAD
jgi:hypothetical protein